jgi:hypothetical protein
MSKFTVSAVLSRNSALMLNSMFAEYALVYPHSPNCCLVETRAVQVNLAPPQHQKKKMNQGIYKSFTLLPFEDCSHVERRNMVCPYVSFLYPNIVALGPPRAVCAGEP